MNLQGIAFLALLVAAVVVPTILYYKSPNDAVLGAMALLSLASYALAGKPMKIALAYMFGISFLGATLMVPFGPKVFGYAGVLAYSFFAILVAIAVWENLVQSYGKTEGVESREPRKGDDGTRQSRPQSG